MAKIPVEEKSGGASWLWWLLGLLVLGGLIWLLVEVLNDDAPEVADVETVAPMTMPEPVAEAPMVTIGDILGNPDGYIGEAFPRAEVTVAEVPTDRGFWIEDEGQRLFAIVIDQPAEERVDINPGQTLRIEEGTLRDRTYLPEIEGEPLDMDTQTLAEQQDIFLVVDERYINILEAGTPQPGTDPAESVQ